MTWLRSARGRALALVLAVLIWLPSIHLFYYRSGRLFRTETGLSTRARELTAWQLHLWQDPSLRQTELDRMRQSNAEWDFMGRSFLVWALGNIALREPSRKAECLAAMDTIIDETLRLERERGMYWFLMPYAHDGPFVQTPAHSQFVDGEIALMLGVRRIVEENPRYRALQQARIDVIVRRMESSPTLSAESYPDECWTFCNSVALAAIKTEDYLDHTDHSVLFARWVDFARTHLTDPKTGLLISAYTLAGKPIYGPEGSSIWLVAHCLAVVDPAFAVDQYRRAKKALAGNLLGFGYAREWLPDWRGSNVIDSGPVVPGFEISPGSTGMAFLGASTFDDRDYLDSLARTLDFAAFPIEDKHGLRYGAGNQVGDAVLLYASVMGPVWDKVRGGKS